MIKKITEFVPGRFLEKITLLGRSVQAIAFLECVVATSSRPFDIALPEMRSERRLDEKNGDRSVDNIRQPSHTSQKRLTSNNRKKPTHLVSTMKRTVLFSPVKFEQAKKDPVDE